MELIEEETILAKPMAAASLFGRPLGDWFLLLGRPLGRFLGISGSTAAISFPSCSWLFRPSTSPSSREKEEKERRIDSLSSSSVTADPLGKSLSLPDLSETPL